MERILSSYDRKSTAFGANLIGWASEGQRTNRRAHKGMESKQKSVHLSTCLSDSITKQPGRKYPATRKH